MRESVVHAYDKILSTKEKWNYETAINWLYWKNDSKS